MFDKNQPLLFYFRVHPRLPRLGVCGRHFQAIEEVDWETLDADGDAKVSILSLIVFTLLLTSLPMSLSGVRVAEMEETSYCVKTIASQAFARWIFN